MLDTLNYDRHTVAYSVQCSWKLQPVGRATILEAYNKIRRRNRAQIQPCLQVRQTSLSPRLAVVLCQDARRCSPCCLLGVLISRALLILLV